MSATLPRMKADEFIAWAMEQPKRGRYELEDGRIVHDMAPEQVIHVRLKARIWQRLDEAIAEAGLPCEALLDGLAVVVDEQTAYEPDVLVRCGPKLSDDTLRISDPMIVVEVASPSTAGRDAGRKLVEYFRLPSVQHYLRVLPEKSVVVHHWRGLDAAVASRIIHDGIVRLDRPGIVLDRFWPAERSA